MAQSLKIEKNLTFIFIGVLCGLLFVSNANANEDKPSEHHSTASTVSDPDIPLDELELLLKPMTSEELIVEADAWFKPLRETALALNLTKLEVKRDNVLIEESGGDGGPEDGPADQGAVDKVSADKEKALEHIATLREKRTALIDRLSLTL